MTISASPLAHSTVLATLFTILVSGCHAQNAENPDFPLSAEDRKKALELVYDDCADADILEVESNEDYIEVEYLCNGLLYEIGIVKGEVVIMEEEIKRADIPYRKIADKIQHTYPGYLIDEFSRISAQDTTFIRVEIIKDGIERNVYFTQEGQWYSMEWKYADADWSEETVKRFEDLDLDYDLLKPAQTFAMPDILREISGIAVLDDRRVLCVQDELGAVFEYDLEQESITRTHRFTDVGDFEDLAIVGDTVFVLRSDGGVFVFDFTRYRGESERFRVPTESLDLEGLYYDRSRNRMILASKEPVQNGSALHRPIFSFDPSRPDDPSVLFEIDIRDIGVRLEEDFPELGRGEVRFNPSAIAVHPHSGDIYVLSAKDRLLAIYRDGELKRVVPLSENAFYKPEGLDFAENGDLFVSSEGDKKGLVKARIVRFRKK